MPNRKSAKKKVASRSGPAPDDEIKLPPDGDWRTTDEDEINRRRLRAREEVMKVSNLRKDTPLFSTFRVDSPSGFTYTVEIQDVANRVFTCTRVLARKFVAVNKPSNGSCCAGITRTGFDPVSIRSTRRSCRSFLTSVLHFLGRAGFASPATPVAARARLAMMMA